MYVFWVLLVLVIIQIEVSRTCLHQDECELKTSCCVALKPRDYRRGLCRSKVEKGKKCNPGNIRDMPKFDLYYLRCPCEDGLECIPSAVAVRQGVPEYVNSTCM